MELVKHLKEWKKTDFARLGYCQVFNDNEEETGEEEFLEDLWQEDMDYIFSYLDNYDGILVVLDKATWNNASGIKIFDNKLDILERGYNVEQYVKAVTRGGKITELTEFHHDKPQGHTSYIIGLTRNEYLKLNETRISKIFDYVSKLIEKSNLIKL